MTTKTRRDLREEAAFLPESIGELMQLRERLLDAGHSRRVSDGLCMWLLAKHNGERDTTAPKVRSNYRRILRELGPLEPAGPANGRRKPRRARADDGLAALRVAAAGATGAAVALATGNTAAGGLAAAAVLTTPRIPDSESYVELPDLAVAA